MRKWIAAVLMLFLMIEMLPVDALAVVVSGTMITEDELNAACALAGMVDGTAEYHVGMRVNDLTSALQLSEWLEETMGGALHSVGHVTSRAQTAMAQLSTEKLSFMARPDTQEKISRIEQLTLEAEDLRLTLKHANDVLEEDSAIIQAMTRMLKSDQAYDYEKLRYSERIRQAGGEIQAIRQQIVDNSQAWLTKIDQMHSVLSDAGDDSGLSEWLDLLFNMTVEPVTLEAPVMVSSNPNTRASRLSDGESVLSSPTTTVTVLGKDTVGIRLRDEASKPAPDGIKVSVRDALNPSMELRTQTTGPDTKDEGGHGVGWVAFNIQDFVTDDLGNVNLYIEIDASAIKDSTGKDMYRSKCDPKRKLIGGQCIDYCMEINDGKPYVYKATFNGYDMIHNQRDFYYSSFNDGRFDIVVETRNIKEGDASLAPILMYSTVDGLRNVHQIAEATSHEGNVYTFNNTWKSIMSPAAPDVFIHFGKAGGTKDDPWPAKDRIKTMLHPVRAVFNQPTDISNVLKGPGSGFGFNFTIPGIDRTAGVDFTPDVIKKFFPRITVNIDGTVAITVGIFPDKFHGHGWKNEEMEQFMDRYKEIQQAAKISNMKQTRGQMREHYNTEQRHFMCQGGVSLGFFIIGAVRWQDATQDENNTLNFKLTVGGGAMVNFYVDFTWYFYGFHIGFNINFGVGLATGVDIYWKLKKSNLESLDSSFTFGPYTLQFRLTITATLGIGAKDILDVWVKGAGYLDFTVQFAEKKSEPQQLLITGGASVYVGATVLFIKVSFEAWKGGPWTLYDSDKRKQFYSLLDHYMPDGQDEKNEDPPTVDTVHMGPDSYPNLVPPDPEVLLKDIENGLEKTKIVTLGDDLYIFYVAKDSAGRGNLYWRNITSNTTGNVTDAIRQGRALYPNIYDLEYVAQNVIVYDFDVTITTAEVSGGREYKSEPCITVAAVCASMFDDEGYPLEVEENVCLYALHLWRKPDGSLSCAMNADESKPGFFRYAWIGGRNDAVDFIATSPVIGAVTSKVTVGEDNSYTYVNDVGVEVTRMQYAGFDREQIMASIRLQQTNVTTVSGGKPDKAGMKVTNGQESFINDEIASGMEEGDYVRVFHMMGMDDSWLAVSRSDGGDGESGIIEFYDKSMDAADEDDRRTIVLDKANTRSFTQAMLPMQDGQYARVVFYVDDVANSNDEGDRRRIKSLYLEPTDHQGGEGNLELLVSGTSYDIDMPTNTFKMQTIAGAINLYWLSTVKLKDKTGNDYDAYRVMTAVYDPGTNTLSNAMVCAEFKMPEDDLAISEVYLTPTGKGYLTASRVPKSASKEGTQEKTPVSVYRIQTTFAPQLNIESQTFQDTLVSPSAFDDYTISVMNDGNMAVSTFEMEMLLKEKNKYTTFGTLHADCLFPENSRVVMNDREGAVAVGEKAFKRVFPFDHEPQRRDWLLSEKNKKYIVQNGKLVSDEVTDEQVDYVTTNAILPGALTVFKSTMQIPSTWDGKKVLEMRISKMTTNTNWVGKIARAAKRNTISAMRNNLAANSEGTDITYVLDPETGKMVLQSDSLQAGMMAQAGLLANTLPAPNGVTSQSLHDLRVNHTVYRGPNDEKWLNISFFDLAETGEPIKLCAEMYLDGAQEPVNVSLPYYENVVSSGVTHSYNMPLSALVDPNAHQRARVVIRGVDIEETALADNEFTLYLDGAAEPLMILSQPRDVTCKVGETASFDIGVSGGTTPYQYQWQVWMDEKTGWVDLKDAILPLLTVENVTMAMSGRKARCIVTDNAGQQIVSDAATLTVIDPHPVDTGDHSNLPAYLAVAIAALALILVVRRRARQG